MIYRRKHNLRIIFFGSSKHSLSVLKALIESPAFKVVTVVTQPDRPSGRHKKLAPTEAKLFANAQNIKVLTPATLHNNREFLEEIKKLKPDLLIAADYGLLIPKEILDIPNHGGLNLHPSYLPAYRGPAPAQWAILRGEKRSGVSIIKMSPQFDVGQIASQKEIDIDENETPKSFYEKSFKIGARLLLELLPKYVGGKVKLINQGTSPTLYARRLTRDDGKIDWKKSDGQIERMIRALYPWPGTWTTLGELFEEHCYKPDTIRRPRDTARQEKRVKILKAHLDVQGLVIDKLQLEGEKPISWKELENGHLPPRPLF